MTDDDGGFTDHWFVGGAETRASALMLKLSSDPPPPLDRAHVSPGEAVGAKRLSGPGLDTGEPEHPGVLPGPRKQ